MWLAEKQQIPILHSLVWTTHDLAHSRAARKPPMRDNSYLRGTQTKIAKCYLSVRDIQQKIYIVKSVFRISLMGKCMYIINMVAAVTSTGYPLSVDFNFGQNIINKQFHTSCSLCQIICIHIVIAVLWGTLQFQHKNDIRSVFTSMCFVGVLMFLLMLLVFNYVL